MSKVRISEQAKRRNGFFEDLVEYITYQLEVEKIPNAESKAEEIVLKLHEHWGGQTLSFPQKPRLYFDRLKDAMLSEYTGNNRTELLRKYNISESLFYRWMNEKLQAYKKKAAEDQGQLDL